MIPDSLILNYQWLKVAIFEEVKPLFADRPSILIKWQQESHTMSETENRTQAPDAAMSKSFLELYLFFTQTVFANRPITKHMLKEAVINYKDSILSLVIPTIIAESPKNDVSLSQNKEIIDQTIHQDYIYSSMDSDYHLMRDIVTKKKEFKKKEAGIMGAEILDNQGNVRGMAELRPSTIADNRADQQKMWLSLMESTIHSLDEMTADIFDLISYLWMVMPKDAEGYIEFHSDDALRLRFADKELKGEELYFREKERFNIMKRVAALSSVWVSMGDDQIKIINTENIESDELYKFKDYKRMFEIGSIRVAFDKKTNEAKGIYAIQIKPSSILMPYLDGTKQSLGVLDLKVFQYSHYKQREHKRLTRYLNYQWKIRTLKKTIHQPFKVSTLLKAMDFSKRYNGVQIRDKFETILDDLQRDNIIKCWGYNEPIDESLVGKKGWFDNYWTNLNVTIMPLDVVVKENQKKITINASHRDKRYAVKQLEKRAHEKPENDLINIFTQPVQESFKFEEEVILTPEKLKCTIEASNKSIRKVAEEIGLSHSTLSRYINKKSKRQNKSNDVKMLKWLQQHTSIT